MHGIQQKIFFVLVPRKKALVFFPCFFFLNLAPVMKKNPRNFEVKIPKNFEDYCCRKVAKQQKSEEGRERIHRRSMIWYVWLYSYLHAFYHGNLYQKCRCKHIKYIDVYTWEMEDPKICSFRHWLRRNGRVSWLWKNHGSSEFLGTFRVTRKLQDLQGGTFWLPKMTSFDLFGEFMHWS